MGKLLILCDSTCDLSFEQEHKYDLRIVSCTVELDGLPYKERHEIDAAKLFDYVERTGKMPHHSQVTVIEFVEEYMKAARDGYTDLLCITLNSKGSGTNSAAHHAISLLASEYPALAGKINIRVVDSGSYSAGITNGLLMAIRMRDEGKSLEEIYTATQDLYDHQITLVGLYNLKYAKKSGRLNSAAAIVGDALGIKPVLAIAGENRVIAKTRGDKNLIPLLVSLYQENAASITGDYCVAYGTNPADAKELVTQLKKIGAKAPLISLPIGPCVASNAGPKMLGLVFETKREQPTNSTAENAASGTSRQPSKRPT